MVETTDQQIDSQQVRARVLILALIVLVGFFAAVCYIYAEGAYFRQPYPRNTFLFLPSARFSDYFEVLREGASLKPYLKYESAQYPFLLIVAYLFSRLPDSYSYWIYVTIWGTAFVVLTLAFLRYIPWYERAIVTFTLVFLSYPFLITIDRGNFEGLVFVLVLAFGYFLARRQYMLAAALLAMAAAMKLLPLFLIILFLREKKYRAVALCGALTAVLVLISVTAFRGGGWVNLGYVLRGSNLLASTTFGIFTSMQSDLVQRGVALLTLLKILRIETGLLTWATSVPFLTVYLIAGSVIAAIVCLYAVFVEKVLWKRVAVVVFAMLLLPTISADYRLLYVFLPMLLFVTSSENTSRLDAVYLVLFGLLLIPKSYYFFPNVVSDSRAGNDISIAVCINIVDMVVFSLIIMASGARQWFLEFKARAQSALPPGPEPANETEEESAT